MITVCYIPDKYLLNLAKPEDHPDTLVNETKSAFSSLFQQKDKMAAWNSFLSFSEDDQMAIIANNEIFAYFNDEAVLEEAPASVVKQIHNFRDARRKMTADQVFDTMSPKLKSIFTKRHFPMVSPTCCPPASPFPARVTPAPFAGNTDSPRERDSPLFLRVSQRDVHHRTPVQLRSLDSSRHHPLQCFIFAK